MVKVETERWANVEVSVTCESCGHQYNASSRVQVSRTFLDGLAFVPDMGQRLNKKLHRIYSGNYGALDLMICPQCRYTQSWNVVGAQRNLAQLIAGGVGLVAGVGLLIYWMITREGEFLGKLFGSGCLAFWVAVGVGGLVYVVARQAVRLYNPNGRKQVDKTIPPSIARIGTGLDK